MVPSLNINLFKWPHSFLFLFIATCTFLKIVNFGIIMMAVWRQKRPDWNLTFSSSIQIMSKTNALMRSVISSCIYVYILNNFQYVFRKCMFYRVIPVNLCLRVKMLRKLHFVLNVTYFFLNFSHLIPMYEILVYEWIKLWYKYNVCLYWILYRLFL